MTGKFKSRLYRSVHLRRETKNEIARQLKELRGGMTQEQFARIIGKHQADVSRMEHGDVSIETLLDVASALDVALQVRLMPWGSYLRNQDHQGDVSGNAWRVG